MILHLCADVPKRTAPNPAKSPRAGFDVRIENASRRIANPKINGADNAGCDAGRSSLMGGGRRDDEFSLANRRKRLRALAAKTFSTLDEDRRHDVMPARQIREHVINQIALLHRMRPVVPEVVMRITNRQIGLQCVLRL